MNEEHCDTEGYIRSVFSSDGPVDKVDRLKAGRRSIDKSRAGLLKKKPGL